MAEWRNWSGSVACRPALVAGPTSETEVAELVRVVSDGRHFDLLEALAAAVADLLLARFDVERVRVRVRKTKPYGVPVDWAAATVERRR